MSKVPTSLQASFRKQALSICPVTGIALTLEIPSLPLVFDYKNPLANFRQASDFAKLPHPILLKQSPTILAGVCLTFFSHYRLLKDKLSSSERNAILSQASPESLISLLAFFSSFSYKQLSSLPFFSLQDFLTNPKGISSAIKEYSKSCQSASNTYVSSELLYIRKIQVSKTATANKVADITKEVRNSLRDAIMALKLQSLINDKFYAALIPLASKNTLYLISPSLRDKMLEKLKTIPSDHAETIMHVLRSTDKESLMLTQAKLDGTLERFTDSVPAPKKTLAEILASKVAK